MNTAPTLTDGVVVLDRHTDADVQAHLAGEWVVEELSVARIELRIEADNVASRRAAEAAGLVEVGPAGPEKIGDEVRELLLYRLDSGAR